MVAPFRNQPGCRPGVFVTGTDTGVGKTIACSWMVQQWNAHYWKPIQAGTEEGETGDTEVVKNLSNRPHQTFHPPAFTLSLPRSPHEASRKEGVVIQLDDLNPPTGSQPLIIEGAGGVMVPLNSKHLILDLISQLNLPVVVVARTALGTINHTLLTLAALRRRNLTIAGVILNGPEDDENRHAIIHYGNVAVLAHIPPLSPLNQHTLMASTYHQNPVPPWQT